ncbi:thioredoxin family protein [Flavobacterium sp. GSP27]|uniref:thioredoxin family protein n=1 Tax=unclassified Flavobacterium TaxID=196869 RepID=UPI000F839438|nr:MULTISPECIES: thioredoxin family protein [unclassified Flavobacterium]RTY96680.1 thioredoxin family protein [Flavobacterium sp. GSN2]RTY69557.1 thioredoxin family protein [Flavobacterium sp. LB2P53]RTY75202.1 thioredoxin family protein [Flavobacterium sp. LS1R10]RTY84449.1 thioredoxin family protein [Flavobacterium sp. ZB4P23]RTZ10896.1 thioredoxin family protein [Flavobacterium sp. GSP27]
MKKYTLILFLFLGTFGYSQNWESDFNDAKIKAIKENKNILLVFSGSDWCAPCIKLENTIWKSEDFKNEAEQKWVIYKADFPKKKANLLAANLTASNKKLAEQYNKSGNFPLVLLLDKTGTVLGITGYKNVTPQEYIQIIHSFEK